MVAVSPALAYKSFSAMFSVSIFHTLPWLALAFLKPVATIAAQGFVMFGVVGLLISVTRNEAKVGIAGYALLGALAGFVMPYLLAAMYGNVAGAISISIANYKWIALNTLVYAAIGATVGWRMTKYVHRRSNRMQIASEQPITRGPSG